jgi:sRNA-binding protein
VQFDAAPALDYSSAVAAIADAYAPVSRDKAAAEQEKREAAAAAAKAAQAAAAAKRQRDTAINQVPAVATLLPQPLNPEPFFARAPAPHRALRH